MWVKPETRDWVKSCKTTGFNNRRCSTVTAKHTQTHTRLSKLKIKRERESEKDHSLFLVMMNLGFLCYQTNALSHTQPQVTSSAKYVWMWTCANPNNCRREHTINKVLTEGEKRKSSHTHTLNLRKIPSDCSWTWSSASARLERVYTA